MQVAFQGKKGTAAQERKQELSCIQARSHDMRISSVEAECQEKFHTAPKRYPVEQPLLSW